MRGLAIGGALRSSSPCLALVSILRDRARRDGQTKTLAVGGTLVLREREPHPSVGTALEVAASNKDKGSLCSGALAAVAPIKINKAATNTLRTRQADKKRCAKKNRPLDEAHISLQQ